MSKFTIEKLMSWAGRVKAVRMLRKEGILNKSDANESLNELSIEIYMQKHVNKFTYLENKLTEFAKNLVLERYIKYNEVGKNFYKTFISLAIKSAKKLLPSEVLENDKWIKCEESKGFCASLIIYLNDELHSSQNNVVMITSILSYQLEELHFTKKNLFNFEDEDILNEKIHFLENTSIDYKKGYISLTESLIDEKIIDLLKANNEQISLKLSVYKAYHKEMIDNILGEHDYYAKLAGEEKVNTLTHLLLENS